LFDVDVCYADSFDELTKKSLLARFIKQFPAIQSRVSSEAEDKGEVLLVSRGSYERKHSEYEEIVQKKIPENSRAIAAAREHGDLRENAEYKMAKQDQSLLLAQKAQLERDLRNARITDFSEASVDQIGVGSIADLKNTQTGAPVSYTILGVWDGDPENNVISYKTPLGTGLLSKRVGEQVKIKVASEEHNFEVVAIRRYIDAK
jgi:transcription elongation factor GreA